MSTFLSAFDGNWRRPRSDYERGVKEYLVVVDTNVLLELYRFTPDARQELLDALRRLEGRLWVPHQVASEYYRRRLDAVKDHLALYSSVPKAIDEYKERLTQEIHAFAKRCSMSAADKKLLIRPIEEMREKVNAELSRHAESFDLTIEKVVNDDPVLAALAEILDQKTGFGFDDEESLRLQESYAERAQAERPPGYKDVNKKENAHGDYFVWEQILRRVEEVNKPVLLVTNDVKEDWVRREAGLVVGARPELVAEMRDRCGADFMLIQLGGFLQLARNELGVSVSPSTVAQAENVISQSEPMLVIPQGDFDDILRRLKTLMESLAAHVDEAREFLGRYPGDRGVQAEVELAQVREESVRRVLSGLVKESVLQEVADGDVRYMVPSRLFNRATKLLRSPEARMQAHVYRTKEFNARENESAVGELREAYDATRVEEAQLMALLSRSEEQRDPSVSDDLIRERIAVLQDRARSLELRIRRQKNGFQSRGDGSTK
ncbi:PIN domain-containing protein [Streptomyces sp. NPDC058049]|uniref:PIN domain-containing protein n=1 Tax=Streptomyces sp. NPDC058049 TaxID=3346314 RepID=UPI0036E19228